MRSTPLPASLHAAFIAVATLLAALPASAQQPQPSQPQSPRLTPRTPEERARSVQNLHRIVLNVQVIDAAGKPDAGLKQSDFTVLQNHQPQAISDFRAVQSGSDPVEIILALDAVNNTSGKLARFRGEIEKYLKQSDGVPAHPDLLPHPIALALLSESGVKIGEPSTSRAALLDELNRDTAKLKSMACADSILSLECDGAIGASSCDPNPRLDCLNRQFNASVPAFTSLVQKQVQQQLKNQSRIILIWLGQGWPLLNDTRFTPDTSDVKQSFYHNLTEVSGSLTDAHMTLDVVASSLLLPVDQRHIPESVFVTGVPDASHAGAASVALQALAYQSGGMVISSGKDVAAQIARCVADSDSYYVLAFDTPPPASSGDFHSIAVQVDQPGRSVRTRTVYYGEQ